MLSFRDNPLDRRSMLTVGGLGALTLADLVRTEAFAGTGEKPLATGKSVVFLLQHGGPTQFETFDPKIDVPEGVRTVGGVTSTSVPGVTFGATMTRLARLAHRLAVVRSYTTGSASHSLRPIVSDTSLDANVGSLFSRLAGTNDRESGLPTNVALHPNSVEPEDLGPDERFGKFESTGDLGPAFAPFVPGGGSALQRNMRLTLPVERFGDRRLLLSSLDRLRRRADRGGAMEGVDEYRTQAFDMVVRGVADAFDLSGESPETLARYDTREFVRPRRYLDKTNGRKGREWYQTNARTLGRQLLLARRLCEAGCRFVTVSTRFVWDMHADGNNLGVTRGMEAVGEPFDHAVSAFIEDCESRGLGEDILLVATGEMGRTPRVNQRGGRDHWARLAPLLLYGGGITEGQVIGQSTRDGGEPASEMCDSGHLVATILRTLLDVPELRLRTDLPAEVVRLATGDPIPRLHS